jgi:anti-sigma factor RsiW
VLEWLEAFVDRDLGPSEERAVAAHLEDCAACRREHRVAMELRSSLRSLPEHDAPAKVLWAVRMTARDGVSRPSQRVSLARWITRPVTAVAAAATAVAMVVTALAWWQRPVPRPSLDDPEIARAAHETRLALALVGALGRRAAVDEVLGRVVVSPTVTGVRNALRGHPGSDDADAGNAGTEQQTDKGANQ